MFYVVVSACKKRQLKGWTASWLSSLTRPQAAEAVGHWRDESVQLMRQSALPDTVLRNGKCLNMKGNLLLVDRNHRLIHKEIVVS